MRVDLITRDTTGVYLDGKWTLADSIRVVRLDHPVETIYSMDGNQWKANQWQATQPAPTWVIELTLPTLTGPPTQMEVHAEDGDVFFWHNHDLYKKTTRNETYVINEMYP